MKKKRKTIKWKVNPLKERPFSGGVSLLLSLSCSIFAIYYIGNLLISLPLAAAFTWSLSPLFVSSSYELTPKMVSVTRLLIQRMKPWQQFKGVAVSDRTVLLTRLSKQSFMDKWHGQVLFITSKEEREKISKYAKDRIKAIERKTA